MIVRRLKALGDPTRLHAIQLLSRGCCGAASVNEEGGIEGPTAGEVCCHITGADKITSTISHHLHELGDAGLLKLEKRGKSTYCSLEAEALRELGQTLIDIAAGTGPNCGCNPAEKTGACC